ncbi:MAG: integration host factor subunit beta [Hyphomonadaceae bacterium]|jgi:integration host factor subunit beta|nr:integration host factor subunit beta [Hyphomonadaceae bacterium]
MLKSELIARLQHDFRHLPAAKVERAIECLFEDVSQALIEGRRVELRGFGAFSVRVRDPRQGRNPRTGESVAVPTKRVPFFKPGKELRMAVNGGVDTD